MDQEVKLRNDILSKEFAPIALLILRNLDAESILASSEAFPAWSKITDFSIFKEKVAKTSIHEEVLLNNILTAKYLLHGGENVNTTTDIYDGTALHISAQHANSLELTKMLISAGGNVITKDSLGRTPLHLTKLEETAEHLINSGADVNAVDNKLQTPLHAANDVKIVKLLIKKRSKY